MGHFTKPRAILSCSVLSKGVLATGILAASALASSQAAAQSPRSDLFSEKIKRAIDSEATEKYCIDEDSPKSKEGAGKPKKRQCEDAKELCRINLVMGNQSRDPQKDSTPVTQLYFSESVEFKRNDNYYTFIRLSADEVFNKKPPASFDPYMFKKGVHKFAAAMTDLCAALPHSPQEENETEKKDGEKKDGEKKDGEKKGKDLKLDRLGAFHLDRAEFKYLFPDYEPYGGTVDDMKMTAYSMRYRADRPELNPPNWPFAFVGELFVTVHDIPYFQNLTYMDYDLDKPKKKHINLTCAPPGKFTELHKAEAKAQEDVDNKRASLRLAEFMVQDIEAEIELGSTSPDELKKLRDSLAKWRNDMKAAQNALDPALKDLERARDESRRAHRRCEATRKCYFVSEDNMSVYRHQWRECNDKVDLADTSIGRNDRPYANAMTYAAASKELTRQFLEQQLVKRTPDVNRGAFKADLSEEVAPLKCSFFDLFFKKECRKAIGWN